MPEPPLLLADRLLGIEAEPGSMGKGRLWTETDVSPEAWYLHDGRMPAGILIESGQADLMLISYLGVDFLNRSERVYRLLGCDLTYHGSLPAPGDTLRYEIHVDGHASQGDVRLFFFHYDCHAHTEQAGMPASTGAGRPQLSVRNGQAGFFTDEELADSAGVLWDAATGEHLGDARVDPPAVKCQASRFDRARLEDFARGRPDLCFGKGFEVGATHTRSPRISGGKMLLLEEVTELSPTGGPWGRGYLRAVDHLKPDDWFFEGHFKNDPCMPGTLMFEGCLQAMATYVAALGYTLDKDGWRFEPVPDETYKLRCRGQATPKSKELVYEVFVEGIEAGPTPTLWADLLCTVDGRKAFHCRRMGLRLVPGWPLDSLAEARTLVDTVPVASAKGFSFGARSILACAWGKPSEAFGPMYEPFDGPRRVPRLPGPPYLFMSRVTKVGGEIGAMQLGSSAEIEYDIPPDAWYFEANGARTMPFCVLLEAALQPCGWLASYIGSALKSPEDLFFRNLDGTGTLLGEIGPDAGTLITRTKLTQLSRSAGMIIVSFQVTCDVRPAHPELVEGGGPERRVYDMKTVFGFFPKDALAAQVGLPTTDEQRAALAEPTAPLDSARGDVLELRSRPARFFDGSARLPSEKLQMLHRVSGIWPKGGSAGLGRYRSEFDVEPNTWFLKAHFFQDPVQPGSLGLEAMVQLLQLAMIDRGLASPGDRFEPIALGAPMTWKYRGQVLPKNRRMNVVLDLTRLGEDEHGKIAVADASLWVDGMRIYEATGVTMRAVKAATGDEESLSTRSHPFLEDHKPTWTVPALPLMSMVDRLIRRVELESGATVVAVEDAKVHRWLPIVGTVRTKTEVERLSDESFRASLLTWREASRPELSRFEPVASAVVHVAKGFPPASEKPWPAPEDARPVPDPYASGALFHGPAFQHVRSLARGKSGASALLEAAASREILLDTLTHALPHDSLHEWSPEIPSDQVAYPQRVASLRFFAPLPREGHLRCEARFLGFENDDRRFPRFGLQLISGTKLLASLELVETLFPKGALGSAEPEKRRAFLRDRKFVEGLRLSQESEGATRLSESVVRETDWLPGTVAGAYATASADLVGEIAIKEHVAARAQVHPSLVSVTGETARVALEPLNVRPLQVKRTGDRAEVRDGGPTRLDLAPVRAFWDRQFAVGRWPIEDLYYGLAEQFVRRVRFDSPETLPALKGRCVVYLSNHQVAIESLLFSMLLSGLTEVPTITLAKAEHRTSWLGRLIAHSFSYPAVTDPGVITFFQRDDPDELPRVVQRISDELKSGAHSAMVHVEGTRALSARSPVAKMSGAFLDMAVATGISVVPVRFVGGLPVEPLRERIEFPIGLGKQDIVVGRPIASEHLAHLNYKDRKDFVVAAINALMPADEQPFESNPELVREVEDWSATTEATVEHAVLLQTLRRVADPCSEVRALLDGFALGRAEFSNDAKGRWLAELARWLKP
jgi:3-hydroxymyristoyl/3-hydroxydecanoyl-(acyl carrier protein) dehydratase/1-acyl-sn-glycerol-3-phosphate acyltransferase